MQLSTHYGLDLFTSDSQLALWGFAGPGYKELVPMGTLNAAQRAKLDGTMTSAKASPTDVCPLFESLLAAYKIMKENFDPERSNTIVVFTDGKSNVPDGLTLTKVKRELETLADVAHPIRVVLLGIGPAADLEQLKEIAEITGGGAFALTDPRQLSGIFLQALLA